MCVCVFSHISVWMQYKLLELYIFQEEDIKERAVVTEKQRNNTQREIKLDNHIPKSQ